MMGMYRMHVCDNCGGRQPRQVLGSLDLGIQRNLSRAYFAMGTRIEAPRKGVAGLPRRCDAMLSPLSPALSTRTSPGRSVHQAERPDDFIYLVNDKISLQAFFFVNRFFFLGVFF
jgi:hypothetical protein